MPQRRNTLMDPPIEDLLDKVDSKFTLVALSAKRARQINSYYNQLGEGLGVVVPPQVTSVSGKPLTIAFEEISAGKATYHRIDPDEEAEAEALAGLAADGGAAPVEVVDVDILGGEAAGSVEATAALVVTDDVAVDSAEAEITPVAGDDGAEPETDQ
jgi:DNA-directed RNA polymerase subunit omega